MHRPRDQKVEGQGHMVTKTVTVARLLVTRAAQWPAGVGVHVDATVLAWVCMSMRLPMFSSFI